METTTGTGPTRSLRAVRRKAVDVDAMSLVRMRPFGPGPHGSLPLVIEPAVDGVDLPAWAAANRDEIFAILARNGAVLFRGFGITTPGEFEDAAAAVCPDLFSEYGDLPKEPTARRIYQSTPYPNDKAILFHNESSHLPQWPMKQFFFCVIAPETGGETPVLDCRRAVQEMDPGLLAAFESKGLRYTRTFAEGLDVSWQDFFKTGSKDEIERLCAAAGMTCEWTDRGYLRISNQATAVSVHPVTGERVFFNQVQLHHVSCLDSATRDSLLALFDRADLPRNVYFGDGSDIPDESMEQLGRLFDDLMVPVAWEPGDILMLDNMLVSHGRLPFTGRRKVCVAMAEMAGNLDRAGAELLA
jgi:alpha-ketoglutarate-dependent taurine dioxygenase